MLNKFFRPKWQHENPEIRKTAISRLAKDDLNILEKIALHDVDSHVRQQAISKIENLSVLQRIISDAQSNDQEFALKCWVSVLTQSDQLNPVAIENFILDCKNEKLLAGIIAYCDNNSLKDLAISGIKDEPQLLSLMNSTKNGRVWQAIIEKLSSEDAFKKAYAIVNGRDKKSQQTIKHKLDAFKANELIALNNEKQAEHIQNKLNHLLQSEFNPLFEGILLTAGQQWHELKENIATEKAAIINALIIQCEQRLKHDLEKKEQKVFETSQSSQDHALLASILKQLLDLKIQALLIDTSTEILEQEKNNIVTQWQSTDIQPDAIQHKLFGKMLSELNKIIEAHNIYTGKELKKILSVENISNSSFADIQVCITNLEQILNLLKKSNVDEQADFTVLIRNLQNKAIQYQKELSEKSKSLHLDIEKGLDETESLIEIKDLNKAQIKLKKIRKLLTQLSENESRKYNNSLQRINNSIKTLEDWKNSANDEKREALCNRMKNLISDTGDALEKSELIKGLQQEWKSLGHCHNQHLWEQFKSYADEAYLPCQQYFNEQKEIRAFNAEQRKSICTQLESFLSSQDWNTADWKPLDKLQKAIHEEWKKYSPVERYENQALQDRFFNSANLLKDKINDERKKNTAHLSALITQAEQLVDATDIQQAIESYGKLQNEWKSVGISFQKQQNEQWQSFKKAGDALYEKRQNIRKEADHESQENLAKANSICNEIIRLSHLDDKELANSKTVFEHLKSDFKALGSLPKESFKGCQQDFHSACDAYEHTFRNISKREWLRQLDNLETIANAWLTHELKGEALTVTNSENQLPENWIKQLQPRFQPDTPQSNSEHARTLCIEMELLAGLETPAEDTNLKMQWQMSKLAKGFGQLQSQSAHDKIEDLYLQWFSQKCWDQTAFKQLQQRFLTAAKVLLCKE